MSTRPESPTSLRSAALPFAARVYRGEAPEGPNELESLRSELRNEVRAIRALLSRASAPKELAIEIAAIRMALDEMGAKTPNKRDRASNWLRARGIDGPAATRISSLAKGANDENISAKMRAALTNVVRVDPWKGETKGRRIISLVGPSGVGKTTTAAKLAARERMAGKSVALVSCDGFRVGAIDQLERYADLIEASFQVAGTAAELSAILERAKEDVVFVDTSGRPPVSGGPETLLAAQCETRRDAEIIILLCMAASTRAPDATRIATTFAAAAPMSVCITKLDETRSPSALIHGPFASKRPLSLVCFGPRVPEDIAPASGDDLFARIAGEKEGSST